MKTFLDCIPCFVRQALDSARLATDDEQIHEQVVRETLNDDIANVIKEAE